MKFSEWIDLQHKKDQLVRDAFDRYATTVKATIMATFGKEAGMTQEQQDLMDKVSKTIRYHLGLDKVEVTEAQARNVAAHLLLVVPEWRELLHEAGRKGPTF